MLSAGLIKTIKQKVDIFCTIRAGQERIVQIAFMTTEKDSKRNTYDITADH